MRALVRRSMGMGLMDGNGSSRFSRRAVIGAGGAAVVFGGAYSALRGASQRRIVSSSDNKTFNRGNGAEPDTLDPHYASTLTEDNIIGDMFLGLTTEDALGTPVPGAATGYTVSNGGLVYTFTLRDHTWSDGVPVTAQDFVYSYRRVLGPKTIAQYAVLLYPIKNARAVNIGKLPPEALGVRAIDDRTLEVEFAVQAPYARQFFMYFPLFAVPRHVVERHGDEWLRPQNIVTNGAYILKEWVPNDHILLVKNPRFYDADNVSIERVFYYPTSDYSAALKRFRAGEIDIQNGVPSEEIDWLKYNMPRALRSSPFMSIRYLTFNTRVKPFDDLRVRTALSLAIDREVVAGRVMRGGERPAYAFVPPHMPGYPGRAELRFRSMPMAARVQKARALLHEAGFGPKNPLTFDYNVYDTSDARLVSVALQAMWHSIGAEANIIPTDKKNHYNLLFKHAYSVAWAGYVADYLDAKDFLYQWLAGRNYMNYGGYNNPRFDALLAQSDTAQDPKVRAALLEQAEQLLLDDMIVAPLFNDVSRNLVSPAVEGWFGNDIDINRTRYLKLDRRRAEV
ncbi:MAG TPA: peptide ABC transporter substrate-binding protein [Rhizomicrobium sp.]|nr:peptide ABC transporter substrate-binding protein [Rhizomicrobium sp.]